MTDLGAGLAAVAFWGFLAAVVVGGMWYALRERQAQYDALTRLIESGQAVDEQLVDKMLGGKSRADRDLRIAGLIVICAAPGLVILAFAVGQVAPTGFMPLLGVAGLVGCVGVGLLLASRFAARSYREGERNMSVRM